jgi:hypothetical protein
MLPNSHLISKSLCLAASRRGRRPCVAVRGYRRPGQRQHGSQRALDRDCGRLELVSVVSCGDDSLATGTSLLRKYRAIFTVRRSNVYCEPRATSNSIGVLLRNLFHCRCMLAVAKGTALLRLAVF